MSSLLTVTAASNSFRLEAVTAVRTILGIGDDTQDAALAGALDRASTRAATHCRRVFARQIYSQQFRLARALKSLRLAQYPVTAIASVTEDGVAVDAADYELDAEAGLLYRLSSDRRSCWASCKIVVAFTAGYVLPEQTLIGNVAAGPPDCPSDLSGGALTLARADFLGGPRDPLLRSIDIPEVISKGFALPGAVGGMDGDMPGDAASYLEPYRRRDRR